MPRNLRLRLAGHPFHVVQRGNNRAVCFFDHEDRKFYLFHLKEQADRYKVSVHAYVLMDNHVHLLITPEQPDGVEWMMKGVGQRYAQYVNRRYQRVGTLWQGRYYSCLVDSEQYLFVCHRYIECNPVRAGMVTDPAAHPWSSFAANALGRADLIVTPHPAVMALAGTPAERQHAYRALFKTELDPSQLEQVRDCTNGGLVLGGEVFRSAITPPPGGRVERPRRGRPPKCDKEKRV